MCLTTTTYGSVSLVPNHPRSEAQGASGTRWIENAQTWRIRSSDAPMRTWGSPVTLESPNCQWPFQDPKLEVPTIYKAYVRPM